MYLDNAFNAISSRRSKGLKLCLRSIAPLYLETTLERAILSNDILTTTPPRPSNSLRKTKVECCKRFGKTTDLFKATSAKFQTRKAEAQLKGHTRRLLIFAGGPEDVHQLNFDQEFTAIDNNNLFGSLASATGSNSFRNFDLQAILSALHRSKAITNEYIVTLDIAEFYQQVDDLASNWFPVRPGKEEFLKRKKDQFKAYWAEKQNDSRFDK